MFSRVVLISCTATLLVACGHKAGTVRAEADVSRESAAVGVESSPAYFVFNYRISDRESYDYYLAQVPATLKQYGGRAIVADFGSEVIEGNGGDITVVLEFASKQAAMTWYQSAEYQAIIELRTQHSVGVASLASRADD